MPRPLALWLYCMVVGTPVAIVFDRANAREGVSPRRRAVAFALAVVAMPLGVGLWLGLLHRPPGRARR